MILKTKKFIVFFDLMRLWKWFNFLVISARNFPSLCFLRFLFKIINQHFLALETNFFSSNQFCIILLKIWVSWKPQGKVNHFVLVHYFTVYRLTKGYLFNKHLRYPSFLTKGYLFNYTLDTPFPFHFPDTPNPFPD